MMTSGITPETRETSLDAAISMSPFAAACRQRVFDLLADSGAMGLIDEEQQNLLGMRGNTQRPRRIELFRMGLIAPSADKRPTRSGRMAVVWQAVPGAEYSQGEANE